MVDERLQSAAEGAAAFGFLLLLGIVAVIFIAIASSSSQTDNKPNHDPNSLTGNAFTDGILRLSNWKEYWEAVDKKNKR